MQVVNVEGATGSLHTNYKGKAAAAVKALLADGQDFVYIHVEAPDEMGHQGSMTDKITAIEYLDSRIIAPVKAAMDESGEDYRMLILPDHPTPIRIRTHSSEPVPFILYDSRHQAKKVARYTERDAAATGVYIQDGYTLMEQFIEKNSI
jgi:2,3-bisphosphoglycerate-independent phosphoglycerate mutase